jgi:hypothetical protein
MAQTCETRPEDTPERHQNLFQFPIALPRQAETIWHGRKEKDLT